MPLSIQTGKEHGFCFIFPIVSGKDNQIVNIFCGCFYIKKDVYKRQDTEYLEDARTLCERLGIPHLTYDVRDTFRKTIIDYFINEYMACLLYTSRCV